MAGKGQRFVDAGYTTPKMFIEVGGKTLLEWSVDSLPLDLCTNLIFIYLKEHNPNNYLVDFINLKYGEFNPHFYELNEVTRGQAETVLKSKELWDLKKELLIFNIDTSFNSNTLKSLLLNKNFDGILGAFLDETDSNRYSYAKLNSTGEVLQVVEKEKISKFALTGLYHFKNPLDFITIVENNILEDKRVKGEFYVAPIYDELIKQNKKFKIDVCSKINILGTPEELIVFKDKLSENTID